MRLLTVDRYPTGIHKFFGKNLLFHLAHLAHGLLHALHGGLFHLHATHGHLDGVWLE